MLHVVQYLIAMIFRHTSQFFPGGHVSGMCARFSLGADVDVDVDDVDGCSDWHRSRCCSMSIADRKTSGLIVAPTRATYTLPCTHIKHLLPASTPESPSYTKLQWLH